jgi:hypothetical protein
MCLRSNPTPDTNIGLSEVGFERFGVRTRSTAFKAVRDLRTALHSKNVKELGNQAFELAKLTPILITYTAFSPIGKWILGRSRSDSIQALLSYRNWR